ncbi:MAG TPA: zf-HC2 domain-containing protein [Thermoanaerobaculia bacterium]|nr:zf-HC2 domain-containing protein [Thermoanaerobaculia bacterium]
MNTDPHTFDCAQAAPLIPAWADGELTEARSAPLREHLLDCRDCRTSMADLRSLSRWFQPGGEQAVPPGFAARVARRAFAGDTGERAAPVLAGDREGRRTLDFVLVLTAAAAALVVALGLAMRASELPSGANLHADDGVELSTEEILQRLKSLDEELPVEVERQP